MDKRMGIKSLLCTWKHHKLEVLAVFVDKTFENSVSKVYTNHDGRYVIMDVVENDTTVTLVALYAPNQDSPTVFCGYRSYAKRA